MQCPVCQGATFLVLSSGFGPIQDGEPIPLEQSNQIACPTCHGNGELKTNPAVQSELEAIDHIILQQGVYEGSPNECLAAIIKNLQGFTAGSSPGEQRVYLVANHSTPRDLLDHLAEQTGCYWWIKRPLTLNLSVIEPVQ
jgi:hypothetical protein